MVKENTGILGCTCSLRVLLSDIHLWGWHNDIWNTIYLRLENAFFIIGIMFYPFVLSDAPFMIKALPLSLAWHSLMRVQPVILLELLFWIKQILYLLNTSLFGLLYRLLWLNHRFFILLYDPYFLRYYSPSFIIRWLRYWPFII